MKAGAVHGAPMDPLAPARQAQVRELGRIIDRLEEALVTDADKHACIERELRMRRRVYPRRIGEGRMTQAEADREIATMEAILADYAPRGLFEVR